jgi:RND superfamily putative drug exporter
VVLARPRAILIAIGVLVAVALVASLAVPDRFGVAGFTDPGSQSARAASVLDRALGYDPRAGMVILARSPLGFDSPVARAQVARLAARIARDPAVGNVQTAFGPRGLPVLVARDRRQTLLRVHFRSTNVDAVAGPIDRLRNQLREPGLHLLFGGYDVGFLDVNRAVRADLVRAELIAFPLLAVLALLIFGGAIAAAIPLANGAAAVLLTFACLRLLSQVTAISIFALDLVLLLGLGLSVDYGLFLISRYREEARALGPGRQAMGAALATAGRAVALSGAAIAVASGALLVFPQDFIRSMGIGGLLVAVFSSGAALLLTPALALLAGDRVLPRHGRTSAEGGPGPFQRLPRWVMRRPFEIALVTILLLIAAAAPALRLRGTFPDQAAIPSGIQSRTVADAIDRDFVPHLAYPVNIAVPAGHGRSLKPFLLAQSLARTHGVGLVAPVQTASRRVALVQLVLSDPPYAPGSQALVRGIRRLREPLLVGGNTAEFLDLKSSIAGRAVLALAIVAVATLVVFLLLTGSLVLAVKALLFDLLGLLAALGLVVLIFQQGALGISSLFAYDGPSAIEISSVVVMLATMFGLTTDYSILLLSRIVEEHEAGATDEDAVAIGIERSGRVISSAALLMLVALLALASSRVFLVKQLAVGQALAVVIDVALVRLLLVPAMMRLFGGFNWWAPAPLRRTRSWLAVRAGRL